MSESNIIDNKVNRLNVVEFSSAEIECFRSAAKTFEKIDSQISQMASSGEISNGFGNLEDSSVFARLLLTGIILNKYEDCVNEVASDASKGAVKTSAKELQK